MGVGEILEPGRRFDGRGKECVGKERLITGDLWILDL